MHKWPSIDIDYIRELQEKYPRPKNWRDMFEAPFPTSYGGRSQGKTHRSDVEQRLSKTLGFPVHVAVDRGKDDRSVAAIWSANGDGTITIHEILGEDFFAPPEAPKPAKKREKRVDFFPSKVGRIAKMPRYPGVWG